MPSVDQLNDLRRRILAGEEPDRDELRSAIQTLVGERLEAHAATPKTKRAPAKKVDLDDLL